VGICFYEDGGSVFWDNALSTLAFIGIVGGLGAWSSVNSHINMFLIRLVGLLRTFWSVRGSVA